MNHITQLIRQWCDRQDQEAYGRLWEIMWDDLYLRAKRAMKNEYRNDHTLQTNALLNEAYMEMMQDQNCKPEDRKHFLNLATKIMWQILIRYAKQRNTQKRGGKALHFTIEEVEQLLKNPKDTDAMLVLQQLLEQLSQSFPRQKDIFLLHYFAGYTNQEIADLYQISLATVKRDSSFAKAWLIKTLNQ